MWHKKDKKETTADLKRLFSRAKWCILVTAFSLERNIWLAPGMFAAIKEAIQRGVTIQLIVGPNSDKESVCCLQKLGAEIYFSKTAPLMEFVTVDDWHVRYKRVFFHAPKSAAFLRVLFKKWLIAARRE